MLSSERQKMVPPPQHNLTPAHNLTGHTTLAGHDTLAPQTRELGSTGSGGDDQEKVEEIVERAAEDGW